jgi:hypothetical protein
MRPLQSSQRFINPPISAVGSRRERNMSARVVVSSWRCDVSRRFTEAEIVEVWE